MDSGARLLVEIEEEMLRTRQRIFSLVAGIVIPPTMWFMASADFANGDVWEAWAKLAAGITMAGAAVIQYRPAFAAIAPRISMLVCILPLIIAVFGSRGHQALLWHALFPVLCTFLFGRWEGLIWSALMFVATLPIVLFHSALGLPHLEGFEPDYLAVYLCLALLAFGWESQGVKMRRELARQRDSLAEAQQKQSDYAATTSDWFFELDAEAKVVELSGNWEDSIGIPVTGIFGRSLLDDTMLPPLTDASEDELPLAIRSQQPFRNVRRTIQLADGEQIHLQVSGLPLLDADGALAGYRGSGTNVTAQINAEMELARQQLALRRSERMNAIGQLTSGIAHDFNNLLTVISGNLQLISLDAKLNQEDRERLSASNRATQTAADLVRSLLTFARQQPLTSTTVDPEKLLDNLRTLLPPSVPGQRLEIDSAPGIWGCRADRSQLESALINLVVNARDAIEGSGSIRLVASNVQLRADEIPAGAVDQMDAVPEVGQFVCIEVSDTGCGMDEAMVAAAFEPFFTTKTRDHGTGLGLAMVHGFTYQSGGFLDVHSTPGLGTSIAVYLPAEVAEGGEEQLVHALPEKVLLVTSDDRLVTSVSTMLEQLGCRVAVLPDAAAALNHQAPLEADMVLVSGQGSELSVELSARGAIAGREQVIEIRSISQREGDEMGHQSLTQPFGLEELRRVLLATPRASSTVPPEAIGTVL